MKRPQFLLNRFSFLFGLLIDRSQSSNKNTRSRCEIYSKLVVKTFEQHQRHVLMFFLLILKTVHILFQYFYKKQIAISHQENAWKTCVVNYEVTINSHLYLNLNILQGPSTHFASTSQLTCSSKIKTLPVLNMRNIEC